MKQALLIFLSATTLTFTPAVNASEPSLAAAIKACNLINEDVGRLKCFDAISLPKTATVIAPVTTAVAQSPERTAQEKQDAFGAQSIRAREKSLAQAKGEGDEPKEMTFKLLDGGKNRAGKYFFVMENGQVWRQLPSDSSRIRIPKNLDNVEVKIKRKMLGSHILILNGRSIKVKRLR